MSGPAPSTVTSYEESVGSCCTPTPSAPTLAPRGAPVQRQLDFTGGGDDDEEEFLCRVADDIERGYGEAKRRAPPCVCGRGVCVVERDDRSGRWKYLCPSRPKCNHVGFWEEVDLAPTSLPASRNDPKPTNHSAINDPSNPCVFNNPSNHMIGPRTPVNVRPQVPSATTLFSERCQGAGVTTLANISPHGQGAATLVNGSPKGVCATTPAKYIQQGAVTTTLAKVSLQVACATTPAKYIQQGTVTTALAKISPQGARSGCGEPVCQCTAGKCRKIIVGKDEYYVCPILKGKGACSYKVLVRDLVNGTAPSPQATTTPHDEVHHPESPTTLHRGPTAAVNTPSKSPYGTLTGAMSPNPNDVCYRCRKKGHWSKDCTNKQSNRDNNSNACFKCGVVGHWSRNCPQL